MDKDFAFLFQTALEWIEHGHDVVLGTVLETWGSAPRPLGSHIIIRDDGVFEGSVSGGCVEGDVILKATDALSSNHHLLLEYGVSNEEAWHVGLACGGRIRILLQSINEQFISASSLVAVLQARTEGQVCYLETSIHSGSTKYTTSDGELPQNHVRFAYAPSLRMAIVGAVHIAQSLAPMARLAGFSPFIIDPRRAFSSPERFTGFDISPLWPDEVLHQWAPNERSAIVTLTHDPKLDDPALIVALQSRAFYIAALGSRKTHGARLDRLRSAGFSDADLARIHGPAGLAINAKTPAQIAVSILAEAITCLPQAETS